LSSKQYIGPLSPGTAVKTPSNTPFQSRDTIGYHKFSFLSSVAICRQKTLSRMFIKAKSSVTTLRDRDTPKPFDRLVSCISIYSWNTERMNIEVVGTVFSKESLEIADNTGNVTAKRRKKCDE